MKRILTLMIALLMMTSVFGCQTPTEPASDEPQATESGTGTETVGDALPEAELAVSEPTKGGSITIGLNRAVNSLDPPKLDTSAAGQIMALVGDTLLVCNKEGSYTGTLATSWDISDDGTVYTFHLRDEVYFHPGAVQDGRKLVASDVVWSLEHSRSFFSNYLSMVTDMKAVDDATVQITIDKPNILLLNGLANRSNSITCPEEYEYWGDDQYGLHFVGTGAFMATEHVPDQYTICERFEKYWGETANLDSVTFKIIPDSTQMINALLAGEIDVNLAVTGESVQQVLSNENLKLIQAPSFRVARVAFNVSNTESPISNAKVREALIMATDINQLVAGVYRYNEQIASCLPVPMSSYGYTEELASLVPGYDPEGAKALLAEAGYPDGFSLSINFVSSDEWLQIATVLQQFWKENLNVDLVINATDSATNTEVMLNGTFETMILTQGGTGDPLTFSGYFYATEKAHSNYNPGCYSNLDADALIAKAAATSSQEERAAIFKELHELVIPDYVSMYFATSNLSWGVNKKIRGIDAWETTFWVTDTFGNIWLEQ